MTGDRLAVATGLFCTISIWLMPRIGPTPASPLIRRSAALGLTSRSQPPAARRRRAAVIRTDSPAQSQKLIPAQSRLRSLC